MAGGGMRDRGAEVAEVAEVEVECPCSLLGMRPGLTMRLVAASFRRS